MVDRAGIDLSEAAAAEGFQGWLRITDSAWSELVRRIDCEEAEQTPNRLKRLLARAAAESIRQATGSSSIRLPKVLGVELSLEPTHLGHVAVWLIDL